MMIGMKIDTKKFNMSNKMLQKDGTESIKESRKVMFVMARNTANKISVSSGNTKIKKMVIFPCQEGLQLC